MATREQFSEIGTWSVEALDENNDRYFYHFSDVSLLYNGTKNYVIGRKGTGKTAIAEYIRKKATDNEMSVVLSFKNFKFNLMYPHKDANYTSPNQYITLWEYVILSTICEMMSANKKVNYDSRSELGKIFQLDIERSLSDAISKITDRDFSVNLFGLGAGVGPKTTSSFETNLDARVKFLYRYVEQNICDSKYFVIFDALDEDYKDVLNDPDKNNYFHLLIGLFKAAQNIRRYYLRSDKIKIVPLIFLRNDIFDLCRDPDKNKWLDRAIQLDWNPTQLRSLIDFRLTRVIDPRAEAFSPEAVWSQFFIKDSIIVNHRHQRREDVFKFMLRSTFNRPRDVVNYIRECCTAANAAGLSHVTQKIIRESNTAQAKYMRREVTDEVYSVVDNITEILDLLSSQRKSIFSQSEFEEIFNENFPTNNSLNAREILKLLYHFNVIGNVTTGNHQVYSYNSSSKNLNIKENVCIHRGIMRSLDIF